VVHDSHTHDANLDPTHEITNELTLDHIRDRAVKGVIILTGRTFLLQALSFAAWFFLTILLDATSIGIFFVVSAVVSFFRYFSDVGLAAALIQKKEELTSEDLATTFTIQQGLVLLVLAVLYIFTPYFTRVYGLDENGLFLLYALGIGFFLASLKTIPSILLERKLHFEKLVVPDVLENLVYNISAVFFAWMGYGVASFAYAILIRGIVGVFAIYFLRPWKPIFGFSTASLHRLLKYGVPYQLNTFLATIKDDGMTAVLGGILGTTGIGYLGWAQKWAQTPLRLFMDNVTRVTFPAFSRMQDDKDALSKSVTRSIFFICFLVFPSIIALLILAPILVEIIPRYSKWQPAILPLYLLSINIVFAAATTQLTNLLNATGHIKVTFKLMVMWTVLTWATVPYLAVHYGVNGAALGYALVGISSVVAMAVAYRFVKFSLKDAMIIPLLASVGMGIVMYGLRTILPASFYSIFVLGIVGAAFYFGTMYYLVGQSLVLDAKKSFRTMFNKK
jgi:O-antigen/teichoic acid export membrane protein